MSLFIGNQSPYLLIKRRRPCEIRNSGVDAPPKVLENHGGEE